MNNERVPVPGCKATTAEKIMSDTGVQILKVRVEAGGEIPMHSHDCAATMIITSGSARALGKGNRMVSKGDVVVKVAREAHGFDQISAPFEFISVADNSGIMQTEGWDIQYH